MTLRMKFARLGSILERANILRMMRMMIMIARMQTTSAMAAESRLSQVNMPLFSPMALVMPSEVSLAEINV